MRERVEMRVWEQRDARRCPTEYRNIQAEPLLHELVPAFRRVFRFEEMLAGSASVKMRLRADPKKITDHT